jgi:hypothetical protein
MKKSFFKVLLLGVLVTAVTVSCNKDSEFNDLNNSEAEFNQETIRACGMSEHMDVLLSDPKYKASHELKFRRVAEIGDYRAECTNKVIIPVAVHYQGLKGNYDEGCLKALAQNQIDILNADYGGTNFDIGNWTSGAASYFPDVNNGEACIEFCIATKNHPGGYGLIDGDPAVTFSKRRTDNDSNWSGYINIFVRNIQYLGYSPLGGSGNGDGVVIDDQAFGSAGNGCGSISPGAPYDLGRTLTHELGHYLLLDHIWGGGCGSDDGISDTPDSSAPWYGCPSLGAATCSSTDMHMNYMDYTNDACMYMFSAGQASRMEGYIGTDLSNVVANGENVCGDVDPCTDCGTCTVPDGVSANTGRKNVSISWNLQASASGYEVQYRPSSGGSWTTVSTSSTSISIRRLSNGSYEYQVRAICSGTPTDWSSIQTFNI